MGNQKKEEEEKKVPVFTVFKRNSILKNIFLDAPQTNEPPNSTANQEDEEEQVIVIGRHPDCSITLDHPSISRFHLRLHSNPSSLKLSLVDLSSVHGTWVSGKKVKPGVEVDLNEGDIVQLGGSSRRYILHWVPMSRAYNLDIPFVPPMDVLMTVKETEEISNLDENCCLSIETNQIQSQCTSMGDLDLSISKKDITMSPSSPKMPEFEEFSCDSVEAKKRNLSNEERKQNEVSGISSGQPLKEELTEESKNQHFDKESEILPHASCPSNDQTKDLFREEHDENEISGFSSKFSLKESAVTKFVNQQSAKENDVEHEKNEITGFSSETPLKELAVTKCENQQSDEENDDYKENEISGFSSGTPLKESAVTKFENQQYDEENDEHPQALAGILIGVSSAKSPSVDSDKNLLSEVHEKNEISAFSSGQLLNESVSEIVNQQIDEEHRTSQAFDGAISDIAIETSPIIDHNEHQLKKEHQLFNESVLEIECQQYDETCENSQALDGVLSGIVDANSSSTIYHKKHPWRGEFEEYEISAFSSGQLPNEPVEITYLQYDGEDEESQPLDEVLYGIANSNGSPVLNHYEQRLLREEFEEHETSAAFIAEELPNEFNVHETSAFIEIESQQYDEACENSQALDGVPSGVEDSNSSPTIYHNEHPLKGECEESEVSAFSSRQLLSESVVECLQSDREDEKSQALDGDLSGIADANSSSTFYHSEHPLKEEFEKNEISAFLSRQLLGESVLECLQCDREGEKSQALDGDLSGIADANSSSTIYHNEHPLKEEFEKNEISALTSVQLLNESVVEIGNQQFDEDHEKSQAVDGVPHSLCQNYHNKNLPEFFSSSFSDENVEIICASRMENELEKMSFSGCYSPCSSSILERKDQLYLYEQDNSVQCSSSSGVHTLQPLKNTPTISEQESNSPEIKRHSLSNVCGAAVGESSEALDDKSSAKGDNKQEEISVITGVPKMDPLNLSVSCKSIPTEDCLEQLDEKINTGETFVTNLPEPKDTDVNTPLLLREQSDPPRSTREKPTSIDNQTGTWFPTDTEVKELYKENVDYESVSGEVISDIEVFAEEIFTPGKENYTPDTLKQRSTKKTDKLEETKLLDPLCLSSSTKNSICWNVIENEELIFSSDKENHTPKVLQKSRLLQPASKNSAKRNAEPATKNKINRIPFKSLLSNSSGKSCSNDTTSRSSNSNKYAQLIEKNAVAIDNKRWIMVADTGCLLNKVSRKALQLLRGEKGTQLIIPRVVMRELDCMKRRGYFFTKTTEISSALQWIEDCMKNTNWWIHVESLEEEGRHLTPASSPSTSEGEIEDLAFSSAPFSASLSFLEIVSPTPGDHILEYALHNRRMKIDENLVILSDDVSLKIKAMAEGIICEAAEEFRESLVNPFSDRFLWAKSSPRGLTWACVDDIVLREKYYCGPFKKPPSKSGESLKGLKLILVQNSHFRGLIPNSLK